MGKLRKSIVKTMVLVLIALFIFPMLNFSVTVQAAETYNYITQWGSYGSGNGQFNAPLGVAVDSSGNVYVADWGANNRVQKFTGNGVFITSWGGSGSGNGQFSNPGQVAVDSSGNVYVADAANNRVQKFTSDGVFITSWGGFSNPIGVAVDNSGNVCVLDSYNSRVAKFTSSGEFITSWGTSSAGWCDAVDSSGNVYVVEPYINLVEKFTSTGALITSWGGSGSGNGQFNNPTGIAVDSQDNVYVTDTYNNRVQKFTSSGVFVTQWSISGYGWGVAVDSSGNVYVSDYSNNCIQKFSMQGPSNPAPSVAWSQTYSGSWLGGANSMIQTADGGYALAGHTDLTNVTVPNSSAWLIKTDSTGNLLWNRTYLTGLYFTDSFSLNRTSDGGYFIACGISIDGSIFMPSIIKTDSNGNKLWNKTYGGIGNVYSVSAIQTTDGGYALVGTTDDSNAWLVKTDSNGNMLWDKTYGGNYLDGADSIVQTVDGGYTIAGYSSPSGNIVEPWIFRTDSNGNILWSKTYQEATITSSNRLIQTADGGYALAGSVGHNPYINSSFGIYGSLLKTDANGNKQWNQTYGGIGYIGVFSLSQTQDGGFAILGNLNATFGGVLVRTDSTGTVLWSLSDMDSFQSKRIRAMILTNDGGYAFSGLVMTGEWTNSYGAFLAKTYPEQGAFVKPVLQIGNVVVGNPASSAWNCKVTDSATGTLISEFTLPATGTSGSYTNTVELSSAGSYVVFEEPKLGYHTSTQINGSVIDSFQSTVTVDAGDNLQVLFTNTALAPGSLELPPPSDMSFSVPPLALVPIQASWNPDANKDGRLDMVVNKTMAVIINFTAPVNPSDIVTFSVKFDQEVFNKTGYGAILRADSIVTFCPIMPKNLGNKELNGTYQINNGSPIIFPSLTVAVKETVKLPLYYAYFTRSDYTYLSQTAYTQMASDSTDFIRTTYPVTSIPANLNYNSLLGNATARDYGGANKDLIYLTKYAKSHSGENTNVIGVAIEPASYFTYHGFTSNPAGYYVNPSTKSVIVLDGGYTEAAHEVGHVSYTLYAGTVPEYYNIPGLSGTIVSGVCPDRNQWRTGWDIMDYSSLSGYNWVGKTTYDYLFNYTRTSLVDPEILVASGIIYSNGTVDLFSDWYYVAQGIPDSIAPGKYSLQFLAANGTVLGSISFDASPLETDGTPFCFATTYPKGTAEVKVLNTADQSVPPKTLATVQAEDIVKVNNGITFTQTGLPVGASWSVTLGSRTFTSTTPTMEFTGLAEGNYNWNSSTEISGSAGVRYAASVSSGTVNVIGNITKSITYNTQYQLSFAVSPLGAGSINPDSTNYFDAGSQVLLSATANDQYQFLKWSSSSPSIVFSNAALPSTSATVNGPGTVTAAFASIIGNSLAFTETGLPLGKSWSVTLGDQTLSSNSGAIVFTGLVSGSYSWSASTLISGTAGVRYAASTSSGTVNVAGQTSRTVTYATQYQVSFAMNMAGVGTVNPTTATYYDAGSKVPISATPKSGYNFWSWTTTSPSDIYFQSNSLASTTATINGAGTITANFAYVVTDNRNLVFTGTNNLVLVTGGNNVIDCRKATSTTIIKTGSGNNVIYLGEGDNFVKETVSGNDIITSGNGNNNIDITGKGNYQITTGSGNDIIRVTGDGDCIIKAGDGDNQVTVLGKGNNQITAGSGSDVIVSGDGKNTIKTGDGNNKVIMGKGNNQIITGTGSDEVVVGNGNNNIQTGVGDDFITVGLGNNYINGGADYDICVHGTGKNTILNCEKGVN
jgi:DNA-binding beta-propeller fold protein YncE